MDIVKKLCVEANRLVEEGRSGEAAWMLERAIVESLNSLSSIYYDDNNRDMALRCLMHANAFCKGDWITNTNLAHTYNCFDMMNEAKAASARALEFCDSNEYSTVLNHAIILNNLKDDDCIKYYRRAIEIRDSPSLRHDLASALLMAGQFEEGWRLYESRLIAFERVASFRKDFQEKELQGEMSLSGKVVSVYNEQGVGDCIQFLRFVPWLEGDDRLICLECQESVASLISFNYPQFQILRRDETVVSKLRPEDTDCIISACSLPYHFGVGEQEIPNRPYLRSDGRYPPDPLRHSTNQFRVGIVWAGNPEHALDYLRSTNLKYFKYLSDIDGVQLFGLQKDWENLKRKHRGEWVNLGEGDVPLIDLSPYLNDFRDTAAAIDHLDLVITIDSAVAHLAGAMGKPVWLLIPTINDWRWQRNRDDSPWYPSMRIFRQKITHGWDELFQRVAGELQRLDRKRV